MKNYITLLFLASIFSYTVVAQEESVEPYDSTESTATFSFLEDTSPFFEIGIGTLSYFGELNKNNELTSPLIGQFGYHMSFRQPITSYLDFNINAWGGRLEANERSVDRNLNFQSVIFGVGVGTTYNFGNFLKPDRMFEPLIGVGVEYIGFNSKADLLSADNVTYHYWADGSIRNLPENSSNSDVAIRIDRDYHFETDIQNSDFYDHDEYNSYAIAIPVMVGGRLKIGENWDFTVSATYHFTTTDYIDGVDENSGTFKGDGSNDNILYTSVALGYNFKKKDAHDDAMDDFIDIDMMADEDADGVIDWEDDCHGTPFGAEVDVKGCPLDGDNDGVFNYMDDEPTSAPGAHVDSVGVTITEAQILDYYNRYYDTTGNYSPITAETYTMQVIASKVQRRGIVNKDRYAVGIGEFEGEIPANLVNDILSVEDVNTYDEDGKILVTVGLYSTKEEAEARQAQLEKDGITPTDIVRVNPKKEITKVTSVTPKFTAEQWEEDEDNDEIIYRVQVGAFTQKADENRFKDLPQIIKVVSDDGYIRYFTGSYKSYSAAATAKIDVLTAGFNGAFVVAFKNGNRVALNNLGSVNLDKTQTSGITSNKELTTEQKENLKFKVQLGSYRNQIPTEVLEKYMELGTVEQMKGKDKYIRYVAGSFNSYEEATSYKKELLGQGFEGCYVVGVYYGKMISASQARKMLNK